MIAFRRTVALVAALALLPVVLPVGAQTRAAVVPVVPVALAILEPANGTLLDVPSTRIVVRSAAGETVSLLIDGVRVNDDNIASTVASDDGSVLRTYIGVPLGTGRNVISARVDRADAPSAPVESVVEVRGGARKMTLVASRSAAPADGRTLIAISGTLLDERRNVAARDALVRLTASAVDFVGESVQPESAGFYVKARDGRFSAVVRAGVHSATSHVTARTGDLEATVDVELQTALRPSVATGIVDLRFGARETNFYRSLSTFLADGQGGKADLHTSGFATGRIGQYLFTAAGDNQFPINPACNGRIGVTSYTEQRTCTPQYPIYGDESTAERLAQSSDNVFVRLERDRTYAMWGDYDSKEFASPTQLYSATQRNLHGAKFNVEPKKLETAGLYANNVNAYQRDSIAPDGTSGYYYLSHPQLTPGTETVRIESHPFDRPGLIVAVAPYVRGTNYDVDYDRGAILFRMPIPRTDVDRNGRILVNVIVATYEYNGGSGAGSLVGGRLRYRSFVPKNEAVTPFSIGASLLHENQGLSSFQLLGADVGIPFGRYAKAVGEFAYSNNATAAAGPIDGRAYRIEAQLQNGATTGNAYYRTTTTGFSNNATTSFIPGQMQLGATIDTPIARRTSVFANYSRQRENGIAPEVLTSAVDLLLPGGAPIAGSAVNTDYMTAGAGLRQRIGRAKLSLEYDVRQQTDYNSPALNGNSSTIVARFVQPFAKRWEFAAEDDVNLRSYVDQAFPSRFALGLAYHVAPGAQIALTHQYLKDTQTGPRTIDSLEALVDDKIDNDTSVTARYAILGGIDGSSATSAFGLKRMLRVAKGMSANVAFEYINGDIFNLTPAGLQFAQPYAVGQQGHPALGVTGGTSLSVGADYTGSKYLKGTARVEHRVSEQGSNMTYRFGAAGKLSDAVSLLAGYDRAGGGNQLLGALAANSDLRVGAAYRNPLTDTTNVLLRFESQVNPGLTPASLLSAAGIWTRNNTFAVEALHDPSKRLELYGKFAFRSQTAFLAADFTNATYTSFAQTRATYRIGRRWDATGELRWTSQPVTHYGGFGEVAEAGYAFGDDLRGAVGYSFGRTNDTSLFGSSAKGGLYFDITARVHELWKGFGEQHQPRPDLSAAGEPARTAAGLEAGSK